MDNFVYHYTSLDALRGILGKELCLWATHYAYLNDPSEQIWAEGNILKAINKINDHKHDSFQDLKGWFGKESYIVSLCKKKDDRNMWRLYCDDGKGVCLVLDEDRLKAYCRQLTDDNPKDTFCIVEEVEYSTVDNIGDAVEKCKAKECFAIADEEQESRWMRIIPFIKNEDFVIESEVRCAVLRETDHISIPYDEVKKGPGKSSFFMNERNIRYRMRGNDLVPYIELRLPIEILKGIILGYKVSVKKANDYIYNIIEHSGVEYRDLKIKKSDLFSSSKKKNASN